jgi:hypothetical protein
VSRAWPPQGISPVDYSPQISALDDIRKRIQDTTEALVASAGDTMREMPAWTRMEETFASSVPATLYVRNVALVGRFIGTELDTMTPGVRGLGRSSPVPPRLGGRYGSKVQQPATQRDLGRAAEGVFLAGFVAAVFTLHFMKSGPARVLDRDREEIWEIWIPRAYAGLRGVGLLDVGTELARKEFMDAARQHRLAGRLRPAKRMSLQLIAHFYASAGAALYESNTDLPERERASLSTTGTSTMGES